MTDEISLLKLFNMQSIKHVTKDISTRGRPHPKYKANSSHIAVWERDPQSLGVTGDELHDGPERGPVDRDGARSTKSKHSTSSIRGLRVSPGRFVGL